jgi:hypothetical protein
MAIARRYGVPVNLMLDIHTNCVTKCGDTGESLQDTPVWVWKELAALAGAGWVFRENKTLLGAHQMGYSLGPHYGLNCARRIVRLFNSNERHLNFVQL